MTDDADTESDEYDQTEPTPPERAPPRRSTAPQSGYTSRQVGIGLTVLIVVLFLIVGLALVLA